MRLPVAQAFANLQSKLVSQLTVHHLLKHGPDAYNIAVRIVKADTEMMARCSLGAAP